MGFLDDLANAFGEGIKAFSEQIAKNDERLLTSYYDMMTENLDRAEKSALSERRGVDTEQVKLAENFGRSLSPEQYSRLQQLLNSKEIQDYERKLEEMQTENRKREKPDVLCSQDCFVSTEHCEECRMKQKEILEGMYQLEQLEQAVNDPAAMHASMADISGGVKCCMCGAPITALSGECPYCGMPFSPVYSMSRRNLPATSLERERLMLDEAAKVYKLYIEFGDYIQEAGKDKSDERIAMAPVYMQKYLRRLIQFSLNTRKMGPMEISKGARHYSMSVSEYIGSIIASGGGDNKGILPWYLICAQENSRAIEEHTEREREIDRKNHEIQMQAMRKKHEIQMETMKRQEKLLLSKTPKYQAGGGGGGYLGSRCCGNCTSYMPDQNKCARDTYKNISGAADYCAYHNYR